jgi:predicted HicB family RNase H-like nuclease
MGRPPLAKRERKVAHLSVRLTEAEHRAAERAAKAAGQALSEWARSLVLAASSSGGADTQRTQPS